MSEILTNSQHYTDIADAIRDKLSVDTLYKPSEMAAAIETITGGGSGGENKLSDFFYDANGNITKIIHKGKTIYPYQYYGLSNLTEIQMDNVFNIGEYAFAFANLTGHLELQQVTSISNRAFSDNSGLLTIYIPRTCSAIAGSKSTELPFLGCTGLQIYCEANGPDMYWQPYWNYSGQNTLLITNYGVTREEYRQIVEGW